MSYLSAAQINLDLSKATISVWFRIPQATADAIEFFPSLPDFDVFDGIIPILVLGKQKEGDVTNWAWTTIGYALGPNDPPFYLGGPPTSPVQATLPTGSHQGKMAPTFIGVDKDGNIAVHIQTGDVGVASNLAQTMTSYDLVFTETDPGFFTVAVETEFRNFSASHLTYPDSLGNGGLPADEGNPGSDLKGFTVTFDEWHHLLLSWDIRDGNASHGRTHFVEGEKYIDETSLLYCAFDDVNKSGDELPGIRTDEMAGQNETISYGTWAIEGQSSLSGAPGEPSPPTYSVEFKTGVKADGIYIPATLEYNLTYPPYSGAGPDNSTGNPTVRPVRRIEMAELQIFAGITLDTSLVINRRAFVDSHGDPVDPEVTEKMLGRRPDVLLHGTSDWQSGANTGSTGTMRMTEGDDDKIIPAGQFTPTALIEKFEPDPSLHESTA